MLFSGGFSRRPGCRPATRVTCFIACVIDADVLTAITWLGGQDKYSRIIIGNADTARADVPFSAAPFTTAEYQHTYCTSYG